MNKKIFMIVAVIAVLIVAAATALAADEQPEVQQPAQSADAQLTPQQQQEIDALYEQMQDIRNKIIDKYAEYGTITDAQAEQAKANSEIMIERMKERAAEGFAGCGAGYGMRAGRGRGAGFGNNASAVQ
ncbi:YckD family protein [Mahella australiensis]|uniref:DUF2680 domain-containing protein n=1 Tax=Mahella australiensis (strain DSM 15567 / CIP 107919 / 50-1 BON) TaxID=697281 RepID=F3ZXQ2_MAHA5|nr:YckD family protein [Mahella australiensis]AEE95559.1 hypothetical protein Mahau_0343 [Mahella australiensis 50-1 BON]